MAVDFCDYFWGVKCNGLEVLYQNFKQGQLACKELLEFFKLRIMVEESYSKNLIKLTIRAGNCASLGSFSPVLLDLINVSSQMVSVHTNIGAEVSDLLKEATRYNEELHKRHKSVKEEESHPMEVMQNIQQMLSATQKSKEVYHLRAGEFKKLQEANIPVKDLEKAENKMKKSAEEYRNLLEKYNNVRSEFERRMTISYRHFQELEEIYLLQMKEFVEKYVKICKEACNSSIRLYDTFQASCNEKSVIKLLEEFTSVKGTGLEKPPSLEFEEAAVFLCTNSKSDAWDSVADCGLKKVDNGDKSVLGADGERTMKAKTKLTLLKTTKRRAASVETRSAAEQARTEPVVDEEGYSVRPPSADSGTPQATVDSDDSDSDGGAMSRILVKINPLATTVATSDDTLRHMTSTLALNEPPVAPPNGHHATGSFSGATGSFSAATGSFSGATGGSRGHHMRRCQSQQLEEAGGRYDALAAALGAADGDAADEDELAAVACLADCVQPSLPPKHQQQQRLGRQLAQHRSTPQLVAPPLQRSAAQLGSSYDLAKFTLPRPPSRRSMDSSAGALPSRGRQSPLVPTVLPSAPASDGSPRNTSLRSTSSQSAIGAAVAPQVAAPPQQRAFEWRAGSRGPSPLTLGAADTVPLAVAFQEVVDAYLVGSQPDRCQVRITGLVMLSFPAGIVHVLTRGGDQTPAPLAFTLTHSVPLDALVVNQQLLEVTAGNTTAATTTAAATTAAATTAAATAASQPDATTLCFRMDQLTQLLRAQTKKYPSASYFNVDVVKYHVRTAGGDASAPLLLTAHWKCLPTRTDFKLEYRLRRGAAAGVGLDAGGQVAPLRSLEVAVPIDGGVTTVRSSPEADWQSETGRATWRLPTLAADSAGGGGGGVLKARFELSCGPGAPSTVAARFSCEGATLSGAQLALACGGYRVSLVKRRYVSGKYLCDSDFVDSEERYAAPAGKQ